MEKQHRVSLVWENKQQEKPDRPESINIEQQYIFAHPHQGGELFPHPFASAAAGQANFRGRLIQGDNLEALQLLVGEGYREQIDLIYIDPPYLSRKKYSSKIKLGDKDRYQNLERLAFVDEGEENLDNYLDELYTRIKLMKELLSPRGSIFVHLDWHVSHYVKIILDEIFGSRNFINEIVWCYGGGSGSKRHFHRKHDLIFWYGKSADYIFNPQRRPYSKGTVERGLTRVKGGKYRLHREGALMQDWWIDINKILSPTAYENLKFPTQKPEALLERLISTASHPHSLVADFYSGSGTTAAACEKLNRQWLACDYSPLATSISIQRMVRINSRPFVWHVLNRVESRFSHNSLEVKFNNQVHNNEYSRIDVDIISYTPDQKTGLGTSFQTQIQFWELDPDYRGDIFRSQLQIMRDKMKWDESLPTSASVLIPRRESGAVAIRVHDIFGDRCMRVFQYG
ncbi:DNA methyltransferase [Syntrophomonas curvata]